MWPSEVSYAVSGEQAAHTLLASNPQLFAGGLADPQVSLLHAPDHSMTVPILFLQGLVLLLFWYNGHASVDSYVIRLLLSHH